jgi:CheY-like chemotaxis protein
MSNKPIILLVDDDPDDIELLNEALISVNNAFNYIAFPDGTNALNFLLKARDAASVPNLIIIDMNMPLMNGRQLLTNIKNEPVLRNIPIVVFTTSANPVDLDYCIRYGIDMITKPTSLKGYQQVALRLHAKLTGPLYP